MYTGVCEGKSELVCKEEPTEAVGRETPSWQLIGASVDRRQPISRSLHSILRDIEKHRPSWKARIFSCAGWPCLIEFFLATISHHRPTVYRLPNSVCWKIEQMRSRFLASRWMEEARPSGNRRGKLTEDSLQVDSSDRSEVMGLRHNFTITKGGFGWGWGLVGSHGGMGSESDIGPIAGRD